MKLVSRLFTTFFLIAGGIALIRLSIDNRELGNSIDQLEAELERARADNPLQTSVVMRSDQDAKYRFAVTVMDICKRMSIPLTTATDSD